MAFIRIVKTTSGATAVQIAYKQKGKIAKIIHIGSAHNDEELRILLNLAHKHLNENQLQFFPEPLSSLRVGIKSSFSTLLLNTLKDQYDKLGFSKLEGDDCRKPGLSKERRLEPQIILGLLVDKNGFPLGFHSFEGNKAETKDLFIGQTGIIIKQFEKLLRPIRSGIVIINGKGVLADPEVPETVRKLLNLLSSGH